MRYLLILLFVIVSSFAYAETNRFEYTGNVLEILSSENKTNDSDHPLALAFVEDFKSAGDCYVAGSNGHVTVKIRNNEQGKAQLSMILSAYMAGKKVRVRLDDTIENRDSNNYCYLQHIRLNNSF